MYIIDQSNLTRQINGSNVYRLRLQSFIRPFHCNSKNKINHSRKKFRWFIKFSQQSNKELKNKISRLTRQLEIYQGRLQFGAGLRIRTTSKGFGCETIELRTKATSPAPLIHRTVDVEVGPAILTPRQVVAISAVLWRPILLILGRKWRHRQAPWQPRALLGVRVDRESRHRSSHRHGFKSSTRAQNGSPVW